MNVERSAPDWLSSAIRTIEKTALLDVAGAPLRALAGGLPPGAHRALRGEWFGHAVHPLLTDYPLGAWISASLLDIFGGKRARPAATGLVAFGVVMTVPTAAAGLAEWKAADQVSRRVGVVHASINGVVAGLYAASAVARLRGRHWRGVGLALAGGTGAWVSGYLGGHLSLVRKVGTADRTMTYDLQPLPPPESPSDTPFVP